jgi:hypothetical protein
LRAGRFELVDVAAEIVVIGGVHDLAEQLELAPAQGPVPRDAQVQRELIGPGARVALAEATAL